MPENETALQKYELTPEHVAVKAKDYMNLKIVIDDKESYNKLKKAKSVLVKIRTGTDARRKEINQKHQDSIKENNKAAGMLLDPAAPAEVHVKAEIKKQDDHDEAIADEKRQKEIERINGIQDTIKFIESHDVALHRFEACELFEKLECLNRMEISLEAFQEFAQMAKTAKETTITTVKAAYEAKLKQDEEDEARKAENERQEKVRLEQEAKAAELKKIEDEQAAERKIEHDRLNFEREEIQAEKDRIETERKKIEDDRKTELERKSREKFEKQARAEAVVKAEREAKEKKEREEQDRIAKEKAEAEEKKRQSELLPDKEKLLAFADELLDIGQPVLKADEAVDILGATMFAIEDITDKLKREVENL